MRLNTKTIQVVIADDHELFRNGFQSVLSREKEINVIASAKDGNELFLLVQKHVPDVVITDISMPGMDGIAASKLIKHHFPEIGIIALSNFDDHTLMKSMFQAGAGSFLLKNSDITEVVCAIRTVNEGQSYCCNINSENFANLILKERYSCSNNEPTKLTCREVEILRLMCAEYSTKQIASKLFLSKRTVEDHRKHIHQKVGAKNIAGVIKYAMKYGIVDLE